MNHTGLLYAIPVLLLIYAAFGIRGKMKRHDEKSQFPLRDHAAQAATFERPGQAGVGRGWSQVRPA